MLTEITEVSITKKMRALFFFKLFIGVLLLFDILIGIIKQSWILTVLKVCMILQNHMKIYSYLSSKCEVKLNSKIHRFGIFAKETIEFGELISIWGGYILTAEEVKKLPKTIRMYEYPVQIYKGFFLGPKKMEEIDDAERFNHSCVPNAGVKGQNILIARQNIQRGEEVCFDYETTDTQDMNFICQCNTVLCRKIINGNAWKDEEFQKKNDGYLSWYVEEKIQMSRKDKNSVE